MRKRNRARSHTRSIAWWLSLAFIFLLLYLIVGAIPVSPRSPVTVVTLMSFLRGFGRTVLLGLIGLSLLAAVATALLEWMHRREVRRSAGLGKTDPTQATDPEMYAGRLSRADVDWNSGSVAADQPPPQAPVMEWSIGLLRELEWKRIEQLAALYFRALQFRVLESPSGPDGGVDLRLFVEGSLAPGILVQCKTWNTWKVGVKEIRELYGVMAAEKVGEGIFLTTSTFTADAYNFARGKEITLIDGDDFLRKIRALPDDDQRSMLERITAGDYRTPSCPSCGAKMVSRAVRHTGEVFWGCPEFPRCRTTMRLPRARMATS